MMVTLSMVNSTEKVNTISLIQVKFMRVILKTIICTAKVLWFGQINHDTTESSKKVKWTATESNNTQKVIDMLACSEKTIKTEQVFGTV